jgi:hypothetical protein
VVNGDFAGKRSAIFFDVQALCELDADTLSYFGAVFAPLTEYSRVCDKANGVYLPPVIMEDELEKVRGLIKAASDSGARYALIGNPSHLALAREMGLSPIADFRLNVTNSRAFSFWRSLGINDVITSPELTPRQAREVGGRAIVYGRIPLMITERCFMKENFGCENCGKAKLCDRKGVKFPMMREFEHRNLILNSHLTYMGDKEAELASAGILHRHAIFSTESLGELDAAIGGISHGTPLSGAIAVRRMGKRDAEAAKPAAQKAENTAKRPHKPLPVLKNDRKNGKSAPKHRSKRK